MSKMRGTPSGIMDIGMHQVLYITFHVEQPAHTNISHLSSPEGVVDKV